MTIDASEKVYVQGLFAIVTAAGWDQNIDNVHVCGLKRRDDGGQPDLVIIDIPEEIMDDQQATADYIRKEVAEQNIFCYCVTLGDYVVGELHEPDSIKCNAARVIVMFHETEGCCMMLLHERVLPEGTPVEELDTEFGQINYFGNVIQAGTTGLDAMRAEYTVMNVYLPREVTVGKVIPCKNDDDDEDDDSFINTLLK